MLLDGQRMPTRVRPVRFETLESYGNRVREALGIASFTWQVGLGLTAKAQSISREAALANLVEGGNGLSPGHFALEQRLLPRHQDGSVCPKCTTGLQERYGCVRCTGGTPAQLHPHDGPRVCRRHRRWIGPGTAPADQFSVSPTLLRADIRYARLRRAGTLDAHRLAQVEGCVTTWADAERDQPLTQAETFQIAIGVSEAVLTPVTLGAFVSQARSSSERFGMLTRAIELLLPGQPCLVLVDQIWLLHRSVGRGERVREHQFACSVVPGPISEYADQLRTCAYPRPRHVHLTQFGDSTVPKGRADPSFGPSWRCDYLCDNGHSFSSYPARVGQTKGGVGCPVCANKVPLAGFNTLADKFPDVAAEWHPELNGSLRPDQVLPGSGKRAYWLCARAGHTYRVSPNGRTTGGTGCGYCSNNLVDPSINALSLTHPHLAAEWHPRKNGSLTPDQVVAGSSRQRWWRCAHGHDFVAAIASRVDGRGCGHCASLAWLRPDIAATWHPTRNGSLTPADVVPGSSKRAWWHCGQHEWRTPVQIRLRGSGCPYCTNRKVSSMNSMRATHPHLAREFHTSRNGDLTPDDIVAGTGRRLWWVCSLGHEWQATGDSRANRRSGCPVCINQKVLAGYNDLATTHPQIAAEWHPTKNGDLLPLDVVGGSNKRVWSLCERGHEWRAAISKRTSMGHGCPQCAKQEPPA